MALGSALIFIKYMERCWCRLNVWNGNMLALDEQKVRCYWCMFEFECDITWYTMHHEWHERNLLYSYLLFNYNGDGIHTVLLILIENVERYRVGFERTGCTLILIGACLYLYDAQWNHHNCKLACYSTTMVMTYGSALILIEYIERYRAGVGGTESTLILVHDWIWMRHCLVYDALWRHRNYTLICYSNALRTLALMA